MTEIMTGEDFMNSNMLGPGSVGGGVSILTGTVFN
jgi:hypothetical protein